MKELRREREAVVLRTKIVETAKKAEHSLKVFEVIKSKYKEVESESSKQFLLR